MFAGFAQNVSRTSYSLLAQSPQRRNIAQVLQFAGIARMYLLLLIALRLGRSCVGHDQGQRGNVFSHFFIPNLPFMFPRPSLRSLYIEKIMVRVYSRVKAC